MAAIDIAAVRDGIKTRLATISGLEPFDTWPDDFVPPAAVVVPGTIDYRSTLDNGFDATFTINVFASNGEPGSGQDTLDGYLGSGSGSVYNAIKGDTTLGGNVQDARVISAGNYGRVEVNGQMYLAVEFTVGVLA